MSHTMGGSSSVAGLSCRNCRHRKSRCNRTLPTCQRCSVLGLDCTYPERQQRKSKAKPLPNGTCDQATLAILLERLQRVEARNFIDVRTDHVRETIAPHGPQTKSPETSPLASSPPTRGFSCPSCGSWDQAKSPHPLTLQEQLEGAHIEADVDVTSMLGSAVGHVQRLRKRRLDSFQALATDSITAFPPNKAKTWVENYFTHMSPKINPPLKDRRLIDMLPDLLTVDHVHIDACMLIIYYCIIAQGCFFDEKNKCIIPDPQVQRQIYVSCLRTISIWQSEATGSMTDLIAAMLMTQTAAENLDFGLSWQMHKQACEYAQDLRLHNLDDTGILHPSNQPMSDADRVNMWNLVQLDLFYRLVNNKPPAFLSALNNWRVNFPWLSFDSPREHDEAVPVIVFLARSRITLILINYFQALECLGESDDILTAIKPLCVQVKQVFEEWRIDDWLDTRQFDNYQGWCLSELALMCYACILFMLRRATLCSKADTQPILDNDSMIPRSELSMRAARKIVDVVYYMVQTVRFPGSESLSTALGTYRAHVAYAHLASGANEDPSADAVEDDLLRMKRFTDCVRDVACTEKDFVPLARALDAVYQKVLARVNTVSHMGS